MAVREELVVNSVKFLQDPSVSVVPLDHRAAFLREKSLTDAEIAESFRRLGLAVPASLPAAIAPPPTLPPPAPPAGPSMFIKVLQWLALTGVGAGAYHLWAKPALPQSPLPPAVEEEEEGEDEEEDAVSALGSSLVQRLEESNRCSHALYCCPILLRTCRAPCDRYARTWTLVSP